MLLNYFTIAVRSLFKNKLFSLINIGGLSVGIAVSILILIFVTHELSFDRFHTQGENIFRAEKQFSRDGHYSLFANPEFAPAIKALDANVINYVRLYDGGRKVVTSDEAHRFFEERFLFADTSFFSIFSFKLVIGQRSELDRPGTVIITENTAVKYFGSIDAVGKTITYDKDYEFQVVGIAQNPPSNSSLQFDFIGSFKSLNGMPAERDMLANNSSGFPTYLLLKDKESLADVMRSISKTTYTNPSITYRLAPLFENHFNLNFEDSASTKYVFIFLCVALLVLGLALINYMNLTTARATTRAKEIGIRKVIGAQRIALSTQFYVESAVTTIISFLLALILVQVFKPMLLSMLHQPLGTEILNTPLFIAIVIALLVICTIVSGSYPALLLPSFKPVDVLTGRFSSAGKEGTWLRRILTTFQFAVSIALIIATLVMNRQLGYLKSTDVGLTRDQVLAIPVDQLSGRSQLTLKNELRQLSGIVSVGSASVPLFRTTMQGAALVKSPVSDEKVALKWIVADESFPATLNVDWQLKPDGIPLAGNHFINETAAQAFGLTDKLIGYELTMGGDHDPAINGKIQGIVKDFNYVSLREKIEPMIISIVSDSAGITGSGTVYVRLRPDSRLDDQIAAVKGLYEKHASATPFTYYFLDDAFNQLHQGEESLTAIFGVFTTLALCVAGLGVLGLATFNADRRMKEISIRKILGASLSNIVIMLSRELTIILGISIVIGSPLAWIAMHKWLDNFFYQVDIPMWFIAFSGGVVSVLALLVLSTQGVKAGLANPAKHLKNE